MNTAHFSATPEYAARPPTYSFGPFVLSVAERQLLMRGEPVRLGGRALDILLALCARAGSIVSKDELLFEVWAGQTVDEGSLRVHISELRKVLSEAGEGGRYVINVPGKGYVFVADLGASQIPETHVGSARRNHPSDASSHFARPPALLVNPLGRAEEIERIVRELRSTHLVSIVGTGGVGKTTVALAIAETVRDEFEDYTAFVDLSQVTDSGHVHAAFAASLGLPVREEQELEAIAKVLQGKRALLLVDNCEHVVQEVAGVVQRIRASAPEVFILTTTREPLHVSGERICRLPALAIPPEKPSSLTEVGQFASAQLFIERACAIDSDFEPSEENALTIANICRSLDGLPLAIEFAASRVAALGTDSTAAYFSRLDVLNKGKRTAMPRHQTLRRTLDWSYDLLSDSERDILCRLGVFSGSFSLEAAQSVVGLFPLSPMDVADHIADLVDKSLVSLDTSSDRIRFRLLNTTRDYVAERVQSADDLNGRRRLHAQFFLGELLGHQQKEPENSLVSLRGDVENVRSALAWAYSQDGDRDIAIRLTLAAGPLFWDLALLAEGARWAATALGQLPGNREGTVDELELRLNSSLSLLFIPGNLSDVSGEIGRALELARSLGKTDIEERVMSGHFAFHLRSGNVPGMTAIGQASIELANRRGLTFNGASDSMTGTAFAFEGNIDAAIPLAERALATIPRERSIKNLRTGVDQRLWSANVLAQLLWMKGEFSRSKSVIADTVAEARSTGHAALESIALVWMVPVMFWADDIVSAECYVERLSESAIRSGIVPFRWAAEANRGILHVRQGRLQDGLDALDGAIAELRRLRSGMLELVYTGYLADAYAEARDFGNASSAVDRALALTRLTGCGIYTGEFLRKKAVFAWRLTGRMDDLLSGLGDALRVSRLQGNRLLEMRILSDIVSSEGVPIELMESSLSSMGEVYATLEQRDDIPDMARARSLLFARRGCGTA
ncbi:ATP-binding protein [Neorhizobium alkalisoli]|uniref:Putative ATPase n=1 Tax=Neorhizobium alkalisoli TaxID=528178 RepID=A0A561QCH0_9HYPH|nr:winged helix-turn-helix domain-containing protein [Neorhizobium alkalisoli]TWF47981.1 putative ATPase [Neorhizobium alkalisoli]